MTRKPSQESNLSSSRNDSSATSNSTATWRLSRSSVSSDANSHSGGGKSSFKKIPPTSLPNSAVQVCSSHITTTATVNRQKNLPTSAAGAAAVIASASSSGTVLHNIAIQGTSVNPSVTSEEGGILRQASAQSQGNPNNMQQRRASGPKTVTVTEPLMKRKRKKKGAQKSIKRVVKKKPDADVIIIDDDEASAKIATNRPRLVRQSAFFSEEVVIEPEVCPVHGPLNPGTYDDEDEEEEEVSDIDEMEEGDEENESGEEESDGENSSPTDPILRKPPGQIGIALVIVPRRLSTISSRDTLSIRSRDESDQLNDSSFPSINTNNSLNPSSSSPGSSPATHYNSNNATTLLLPAGLGGLGRRKMSEQPVQFFVVPASSGLLNSAKWHSMSSVESANQSHLPTTQVQFISSPSQSRSQSRSQSPRGFRANMKHDGQRMTSMAENQEDCLLDREETPPSDFVTNTSANHPSAKNFGFRDPNERRVSFQLPEVTLTEGDQKDDSPNSSMV